LSFQIDRQLQYLDESLGKNRQAVWLTVFEDHRELVAPKRLTISPARTLDINLCATMRNIWSPAWVALGY